MRIRRSVWSDAKIQELARKFVCVSLDQVPLLFGNDAVKNEEREFFKRVTDQVTAEWAGASRQGTYVVTPSGKLLESRGLWKVGWEGMERQKDIVHIMEHGLEQWSKMPAAERRREPGMKLPVETTNDWDKLYPADGLVLRMNCRDLPRKEGEWSQVIWNDAVWENLDYVWFRKNEALQWVPQSITTGASWDIPTPLVERLIRFHMIDNVRCHVAKLFRKEDLQKARLTGKVVEVRGNSVLLRYEGESRAERLDTKVGYESKILGHAVFNVASGRFTSFELIAVGTRWGHQETRESASPTPLGFIFVLPQGNDPRDHAPPRFLVIEKDYWK
jgi:hypothetical protein